jgi:iron complex outermembrane recepter protein
MFLKYTILSAILAGFSIQAFAQGEKKDSVQVLDEVTVQAYAADRPLSEVPASVFYMGRQSLERFNNTSILPAVNTIPGVRMEERSPGSYRFSIRGSLLRSPFGVRNVKMYWNGLPLTDGGGNTYINLLDFNAISNLEVIKGPGSSLYGAGTGGVVLFNNNLSPVNQVQVSALAGSFGLQRYQVSVQAGSEKVRARVQYARQEADGYRNHTRMRRDGLNTDVVVNFNDRNALTAAVFYTDLLYETPGGLTRAQYDENPRQARANADNLKASISNKTIYGALVYDHQWNSNWSTKLGGYASNTHLVNPTFLNYEDRTENNIGGRLANQYAFDKQTWKGKITFGLEHQSFNSPLLVKNNVAGTQGPNLISDDKIYSRLTVAFAQGEFDLPYNFILTAGASGTFLQYRLVRYNPEPAADQTRNFNPVFSPRIALLNKITPTHSVYASVSYGFSPPSLAEVRPSTNTFNNDLNPERGINYEVGFKGQFANSTLRYDVSLYEFDLKETIVIQRTAENADYFINAGSTQQRGAEVAATWSPRLSRTGTVSAFALQTSYTLNHFFFKDYVNDDQNYSGNRLTGVAPNVVVLSADVELLRRLYANITASYTDHIPLKDDNTIYAPEYYLFGARVGYKVPTASRFPVEVFAGVDNLFDRVYSLGNDLNAAGGRYFNTAPGRNFYFGAKFNALFSK